MGRFLLVRVARALVTIILVVTFAFIVLRLSGDPAQIILGPEAPPEASPPFARPGASMTRSGCSTCIISARSRRANWGAPCGMGAAPSC